jgi:hypothetical protein
MIEKRPGVYGLMVATRYHCKVRLHIRACIVACKLRIETLAIADVTTKAPFTQ